MKSPPKTIRTINHQNPPKQMKNIWRRKTSLVHDLLSAFEPKTIPFTNNDHAMKLLICNVQSDKECLVTHRKKGVKKGDHLFEIKGYFQSTGRYGLSESKWNVLPVCGSVNASYKNVTLMNGIKKNLGIDFLTVKEAQLLNQHDKRIYGIIRRWMAYCKSRGVVLSYRLTPEQEEYIEDRKKVYQNFVVNENRNLEKFMGCFARTRSEIQRQVRRGTKRTRFKI